MLARELRSAQLARLYKGVVAATVHVALYSVWRLSTLFACFLTPRAPTVAVFGEKGARLLNVCHRYALFLEKGLSTDEGRVNHIYDIADYRFRGYPWFDR